MREIVFDSIVVPILIVLFISFEEVAVGFLTHVVGFEREGSTRLRFGQANFERLESTRTLSDAHALSLFHCHFGTALQQL